MKLYEIYESMKLEYLDSLIFIKSGKFYVTFDSDALICNYLFQYKKINGKIGFPESVLEHIEKRLNEEQINYLIVENKKQEFENNKYYQFLKMANEYQIIDTMCQQLIHQIKEKLIVDINHYETIRSFLSEL